MLRAAAYLTAENPTGNVAINIPGPVNDDGWGAIEELQTGFCANNTLNSNINIVTTPLNPAIEQNGRSTTNILLFKVPDNDAILWS